MPELIKLNGSAVTAITCFRREVPQPDGPAIEEYQVAVMIRGRMTQRSFASLLESGTIRLELGSGDLRETTVTAASVTSTGGGESAVYRHDFTLRETPASAARRGAESERENARLAAAVAELNVLVADVKEEADEDGSGDIWAAALRKLESSPNGTAHQAEPPAASPVIAAPPMPAVAAPVVSSEPASPAPPTVVSAPSARPAPTAPAPQPAAQPAAQGADATLSPAEIAGVEAVLVGLRLEAIIDALDRLEIIPRDEIEQAFVRLVQKRFVAEASLVVGQPVARRAARDILQGLGVGRWALGVSGER